MKSKEERFLITTANENTWRLDRPVVFLGDWCYRYDCHSIWENLDAEVVHYHWDDHSKLNKDYFYLRKLYEDLLNELGKAMNEFHEANYSERFWRILLGPWLRSFTQILFDRWTMIQQAVKDFDVTGSVVLDLTPEQSIPRDFHDFSAKLFDDSWNSFIYGQILTKWTTVPCEKVIFPDAQNVDSYYLPREAQNKSLFRALRSAIARKVFCSSFLSRQTDAFFISSYLPLLTDFRLQILLGQVPKLWQSPLVPSIRPNLRERQRLILAKPEKRNFEHCVRSLIPLQIPTIYLEGFTKLRETVEGLPWPKRPRLIFTSNNFEADDIFKAWAGSKVENGSKLIIGQHGGIYGAGLWMCTEEHEVRIADRFLTWGWSNENPNVYPAAALKIVDIKPVKPDCEGHLLLVTQNIPRYSHVIYPGTIASQVLGYLEDLFTFVERLSDRSRSNLLVRLDNVNYGWSMQARWQDSHPDVKLDIGKGPIQPLIHRSRIVVETYHGTTHLETLGQNIPTIIFWNPKHWELRPSAIPYFDRLKQVGIFHENPESAAAKISEVWDDVPGWWNQPDIMAARRYFCDRFARLPDKPIRVLRVALTTIGNSNKS